MSAFIKSFHFACSGILVAIKDERNMRIHLVVAAAVISFGLFVKISPIEWCIVLLSFGLVVSMELLNTAIECLVDLVTVERNPLAGKVKDMAAGAVLVSSIISVVIGIVVFWKYVAILLHIS